MASNSLYIMLCSGEHEKVQMAAMMASVGAVSERPVEVFVSMNAILAFAKDATAEIRYHGGPFSKLIKEKHAPDAMTLFRQGKELGDRRSRLGNGPPRREAVRRPARVD
jgi:peroxiredoxin family protein